MNTNPRTPHIRPIVLAAWVSVVAAAIAITAHVVFDVGETPLVIGTLIVGSLIGWWNAENGARATVSPLSAPRRSSRQSIRQAA